MGKEIGLMSVLFCKNTDNFGFDFVLLTRFLGYRLLTAGFVQQLCINVWTARVVTASDCPEHRQGVQFNQAERIWSKTSVIP